jgi:hypothetical protein
VLLLLRLCLLENHRNILRAVSAYTTGKRQGIWQKRMYNTNLTLLDGQHASSPEHCSCRKADNSRHARDICMRSTTWELCHCWPRGCMQMTSRQARQHKAQEHVSRQARPISPAVPLQLTRLMGEIQPIKSKESVTALHKKSELVCRNSIVLD